MFQLIQLSGVILGKLNQGAVYRFPLESSCRYLPAVAEDTWDRRGGVHRFGLPARLTNGLFCAAHPALWDAGADVARGHHAVLLWTSLVLGYSERDFFRG